MDEDTQVKLRRAISATGGIPPLPLQISASDFAADDHRQRPCRSPVVPDGTAVPALASALGFETGEVVAAMPGDALLPTAQFVSTRSITIDATPDAERPWLVQVGCGRAGF